MKGSFVSNTDRNTLITIFIIFWVICILCAIIPIYSFFGLPDKARTQSYFKVDKNSKKGQEELLLRYDSCVKVLDSLLKAGDLESKYDKGKLLLRDMADQLVSAKHPYARVFDQTATLYDKIKEYRVNSKKAEDLTKENEKLTKDLEEQKKQVEKLEEENKDLQRELKSK